MKKGLTIGLIVTSIILLTGCETNKTDIKGCKDCVFDYYYLPDHMWDGENAVGNKILTYQKDYKNLKDENGNQRDIFLGYNIDENEIIKKIYTCIMNNNNPICIEGSSNGSTYEANKALLNQNFTDCEFNNTANVLICNNNLVAAYKDGSVGVTNNKIKCITDTTDGFCTEIDN